MIPAADELNDHTLGLRHAGRMEVQLRDYRISPGCHARPERDHGEPRSAFCTGFVVLRRGASNGRSRTGVVDTGLAVGQLRRDA